MSDVFQRFPRCHNEGDVMKRLLLSLTIVMVIGSTALSPASAWGAQAQQVYNWGDAAGLQYHGPSLIHGVPGTIVQISATNSTSYALTKTGEVWAWGAGLAGALGNGTRVKSTITPVQVKFPTGVEITSLPIPMPYDTGMAIDSKGNIWGWGANNAGSLCEKTGSLLYPVKLPLTHVTQASGGGTHAIYLSDGRLYACGDNANGELGDGTTVSSTHAVPVIGLPNQTIKTIGSSWRNSGAVMANGSYFDWGYNHADQLGNGKTTDSDIPVRVDLPAKVRQLSVGGSAGDNGQTVVILANGSVWAWGSDEYGQLGNGKISSGSRPTRIDVPPQEPFVQVISGGSTMYGIDSSGAVWAWGQNYYGQLGFGALTISDLPVKVGIDLSCLSSTATNVEGVRDPGSRSTANHRGDPSHRLALRNTQCGT
jgi:alpha-tubulin suppressor-like RCC1 family protein